MYVRIAAFLMVGWMLAAPGAVGQSTVRVSASVSPSTAGVHETLAYTLRITGVNRADVSPPEAPATTNLVLQQSTPSTRYVQTPGGSSRVTFEWRYRPMREGTARIKPVSLTIQGETYTTETIRVAIVPQSQRPSTSPAAPPVAPPSSGRASDGEGPSELAEQDLFIRAEPSATTVYRNEQIVVAYRLFFRPGLQLRHSRLAQAWDANGFWREELDVASRPQPRLQTENGNRYRTIVLKRVALFPTRTGALSIDPLRIKTEASVRQLRQSNVPGGFEPVTLASDSLQVEVKSLPDAPPDFEGAVGTFNLRATLSTDTLSVSDDVQMELTVEGTGNLATLQMPMPDIPSAVEAYDPDVSMTLDRTRTVARGTKTFTHTLVPTAPGQHVLAPRPFTYFDTEAETYRTLRPAPDTIHVTGRGPSPPARSASATDTRGTVVAQRPDASPTWLWWGGAALMIGGALAFWMMRRRSDPDATRPRKARVFAPRASSRDSGPTVASSAADPHAALTTAQEHLGRAHRHLREGDVKPFYRSVERAVLSFVGRRLDRSVPGLTRAVLNDVLHTHDVPSEDREALHELLDASDQAQFTPAQPSHDSMQAALHQAQELILHLDAALPERSGPAASDGTA